MDMNENRLIILARRPSGEMSLLRCCSSPTLNPPSSPATTISSIGVGIDVSSCGGPVSLSLLLLILILSWGTSAIACVAVVFLQTVVGLSGTGGFLLCLFLFSSLFAVLPLREDLFVVVVAAVALLDLDLVETTEPRDDPPLVLPTRRDNWSNALMVWTREELDSDMRDW